ncbi:MAG: MoaD/ThiS family protein [Sphingomonadaceae bacterium]
MRINVEILPWLSNSMRPGSLGSIRLEHELRGKTFGDLMVELSEVDPAFAQLIFDRKARELRYPARAIVNDQLLEFLQGMDTKLSDGDTVAIIATYTGG